MKNITLHPLLLQKCLCVTDCVTRRGASWKSNLFKACIFLFLEPNILRYVVTTGSKILEITELVDFSAPFDCLAIDTHNLQRRNSNIIDRLALEIPDCTMSNIKAFNDPNRPTWIACDDLKTTVARIGAHNVDVAYIRPKSYETVMNAPKTNLDFLSFDWNKTEYTITANGKRIISTFDSDFDDIARVFSPYRARYYPHELPPDSISIYSQTICSDVYDFGEDPNTSDKNKYYEFPIAMWKAKLENPDCFIRAVVAGKAKQI